MDYLKEAPNPPGKFSRIAGETKIRDNPEQKGKRLSQKEEELQTESVHFRKKEMIKGGRSDTEVISKDKSSLWINPNNNDV